MLYKEAIAEIKQIIKSLTAEQIEDKKILRQPHNSDTWHIMSKTFVRAGKITTYLNFYNDLRGELYLHSTDKYDDCWALKKLKKDLETKYSNLIQESQVVTVD